jgi:hypothetical protein
MNEFDQPVLQPIRMENEDEDLFSVFNVPIGQMKYDKFVAPSYPRGSYTEDRRNSLAFINRNGYAPTKLKTILHLGEPYENYYSEEFRLALEELSRRIPFPLKIRRGFSPSGTDDSSHTIGIAADINVVNEMEARLIADTAWMIGLRGIAIGPLFVHVDSGPPATWGYNDLPLYGGPNTLPNGRWMHG